MKKSVVKVQNANEKVIKQEIAKEEIKKVENLDENIEENNELNEEEQIDEDNENEEVNLPKENEKFEEGMEYNNEFMPEAKNGNIFTAVISPAEFWIVFIIALASGGYLGYMWSKKIKAKINK